MPVYNAENFLRKAIDSILAQTYKNFEFIIVDDGSTDSSRQIIEVYHDKRIKLLTHKMNKGIVAALNDGIAAARGKYIARMDADDISDPTRIEKQKIFLDTNKDVSVVGTFLKIINDQGKQLFTIEPPTRPIAIMQFLRNDSCIAHGSAMMRSSVLQKVGGYSDKKSVEHAEDYDLFVRIAGISKLANIPEYLYTRHEHSATVSRRHLAEQYRHAREIGKRAKSALPMGKVPTASVLMPNYNKGKYIGEAIESVLTQTYKDWELVIIDDASTDISREIIKKYTRDKRVVFLQNPENLGKAKTRIRLANESIGKIMVELDSDDMLEKTALKDIVAAHRRHPDAGLIYSQFEYVDENLRPLGKGFCRAGKRGETNLHSNYASALRSYKRKYFDRTSGFDVTLDGAEDMDMVYKLEEAAPIFFLDKVLYKYRMTTGRSHLQNIHSTVAHMKAKYYAYLRRKKNNYPNISIFMLLRQIVDLVYSLFFSKMITHEEK